MLISLPIILACVAVAMMAGVLGCFVVWRQMAYFGDALAHSALLGVALGLLFAAPIEIGILLTALLFAFLLVWLNTRENLSMDVLLGVLSHGAFAAGLLAFHFSGLGEVELHDIFLGDMSLIKAFEAAGAGLAAAFILGNLFWQRRALMLITLSPDLAQVEGVKVFWVNLLFMVLMALFVVVASRWIGILLIASLLIVPAATARQIASSAQGMILWSCVFALSAVGLGLGASVIVGAGTPASAAIVSAAVVLFCCVLPFGKKLSL